MFSRFIGLGHFIRNTKFIFNPNAVRFFTKGSKKNTLKKEIDKLKSEKHRLNTLKERPIKETNKLKSENHIFNEIPTKEQFAVSGPYKTIVFVFGFTLVSTISTIGKLFSLRNVKSIPVQVLEEEYLTKGAVKKIVVFGPIVSGFTNFRAEVTLNSTVNGELQRFGVVENKKNDLLKLLRFAEDKLGNDVGTYEVQINYMELIPIVGFFILLFLIPKVVSNQRLKSTPKDSYEWFKTKSDDFQNKKSNQYKNKKGMMYPGIFDTPIETYDKSSNVKFKDVAGLHSAKEEVKEFLYYLDKPDRFKRLGARLPRGAMLMGPPGCGKTLLVKALANESNVPFYYKAGTEFIDMIGGVGAKKIRNLFETARENAPAIIFLDEIDSIGKKRSPNSQSSDNQLDQTLNQLLVEMDGMDSNAGVVVFAATNRSDVLDTALIRPGRFDRHILIDLPVLEERKEIFVLYLKNFTNKLESNANVLKDKLALLTPGMTGADIANLCNEAALTAVKLDYNIIKDECFDIALERIIAGAAKKNKILNETERKAVAYHEAGHVLVSWMLKSADPILRVSIVPRTNAALGFTQLMPSEKYLQTTERLTDRITVLLAGRAAESIIFNRLTSGAHDDLKKVKEIAFSMVRELGMSERVGHLSFNVSKQDEARGSFPYSQNTREIIEVEANSIIAKAYKRAESMLRDNKEKLELLAKELLAKEVLKYAEIVNLIGARPHGTTN